MRRLYTEAGGFKAVEQNVKTDARHKHASAAGVFDESFNTVNQYCLARIVEASKTIEIAASVDLVDADSGALLLAAGQSVSPELRERLLRRKLRKPLEACLVAKNGVTIADVVATAQARLDAEAAIRCLTAPHLRTVLEALQSLTLEGPIQLLLTSAKATNSAHFEHSVKVALVTAGLVAQAQAGSVAEAALAGLVHDVGELYVNPEYLYTTRPLSLTEYRHVIAHPCIGALALAQTTSYPSTVVRAVEEHHERMDGTGYPRQLAGESLSRLSRYLAVAELVVRLLATNKDNPLARAGLALRLVAGEFAPESVDAYLHLAHQSGMPLDIPQSFQPAAGAAFTLSVRDTLSQAFGEARLLSRDKWFSASERAVIENAHTALERLHCALHATGVVDYYEQPVSGDEHSAEIFLDLDVVPREVVFRMHRLARHLRFACSEKSELQERLTPLLAHLESQHPRSGAQGSVPVH